MREKPILAAEQNNKDATVNKLVILRKYPLPLT